MDYYIKNKDIRLVEKFAERKWKKTSLWFKNDYIHQYNLPEAQYTLSNDSPIYVFHAWSAIPEGWKNFFN